MAVINYATLYQQALEQAYAKGLMFTDLYNTPTNSTYKWVNAKTIQIPTLTVGGFADTNRDQVGVYSRKVDNTFTTLTLAHDREFQTLVDPQDIDESNMAVSIANITRIFNDEQKIPEMDKYMASRLATLTADGVNKYTVAITAQNVLAQFDMLMEKMDENEVPQEGRILYVTPAVNTVLKQAEQLQRMALNNNDGTLNRSIYSLDSVKIVVVPSSRMKTAYDFTNGAVAGAGAQQIEMILVHPTAILSPLKYEFVSLDEPSATTGGKYLYYERLYWDVFVLSKKNNGVQLIVAG